MTPAISILVSTYNRPQLLRRALDSVFGQSFTDYELIVIDDCSSKETSDYLDFIPDKRLRYIRNEANVGGSKGDRPHMQRFVNDLARGKYFVYLCDDDYWLLTNLLARQVALFEAHPTLAMVTGAQLSMFADTGKEVFRKNALPDGFVTSDKFLKWFSEKPITSNIITGARLYNRDMFIKSGALQDEGGMWESGYELALAPACYGDHYYINEPCCFTDIQPANASFRGTQLSHFLDSVASVRAGFRQALKDFPERGLMKVQIDTVINIGKAYLTNAEAIARGEKLSYCSEENISQPVTLDDVNKALREVQNA